MTNALIKATDLQMIIKNYQFQLDTIDRFIRQNRYFTPIMQKQREFLLDSLSELKFEIDLLLILHRSLIDINEQEIE